jgi:hypothetical protein
VHDPAIGRSNLKNLPDARLRPTLFGELQFHVRLSFIETTNVLTSGATPRKAAVLFPGVSLPLPQLMVIFRATRPLSAGHWSK